MLTAPPASFLTAPRLLGVVLLLKGADVAERGPQDLPSALWWLLLAGWLAAAAGLVVQVRAERLCWLVVAVCGVGFAVDYPTDLRRQHLVLLIGVAVAALVAADASERLLLWRTQLTAVYGFAVLSKLNESFLAGNVLARDVVGASFWSAYLPEPGVGLLVAMSIVVVLTELLLAVALWVPRWRRAGLFVAVLVHAGALLLVTTEPTALIALRLAIFGGASVVLYATCTGALATTLQDR